MQCWTVSALAGALAAAAGIGAALAPAASAQAVAVRPTQPPRAFEVLTGAGSRIGVSIREVEERDVKSAGLGAPAGAVVEHVADDSPAETAGIQDGDIVVEFDGERVRGVRHLTRLVQETPDGRSVQAVVVRDGQRTTVTIVPQSRGVFGLERFRDLERLGRQFRYNMPARPSPRRRSDAPSVWPFDERPGRGSAGLGVAVHALSPQLAEYFGAKDGVLVTSVTDNSPAAQAGVKAGDVITAIDGGAVSDAADLRRRFRGVQDGDEFTIAVLRDRKAQTLTGRKNEG